MPHMHADTIECSCGYVAICTDVKSPAPDYEIGNLLHWDAVKLGSLAYYCSIYDYCKASYLNFPVELCFLLSLIREVA